MSSSLNLLELPCDVLIEIMCSVPAPGLSQLSQVHSTLYNVARNEEIWISRAKQDYKLLLRKKRGFSPREFYQLVLHKYGKLIGVWKRLNHIYYGGLLKVFYADHAIVIELLEGPHDVTHELVRRRLVSISKAKEVAAAEIVNDDEWNEGSTVDVIIVASNEDTFGLRFQDEREDSELRMNVEQSLFSEWLQQPYRHLYLHERKFNSMFRNRDVYTCERYIAEKSQKQAPIQAGLFKGTYGSHGIELINLSSVFVEGGMKGSKGIKICGDPNVPASQISFVIEEDLCTFVRSEDGELIFDTDQKAEYKDDLTMDFCIPGNYRNVDPSIRGLTTCKGYWQCKCQVANDNFANPEMIQGYFILFSNDTFAVMFIEIGSINVYHRVKNL